MNAILINLQGQAGARRKGTSSTAGAGWGGRGVGILCNSPFRYTAVA